MNRSHSKWIGDTREIKLTFPFFPSFFSFAQEKFSFSLVILTYLRLRDTYRLRFSILTRYEYHAGRAVCGRCIRIQVQTEHRLYACVYIFSPPAFVSAHARVGNKLIKLLARVMRSTGPWMEICAFPFIYRFGWGRDRIRGNSVCPPPVNDTN